jgi:hypothetical protein
VTLVGYGREIKKIAKSKPAEHDLPFSTWNLAKLADFLVAEGVVDDISHEGLRHRPCQPQGAGQHDPPVHHLAQ